MSPLPLLHGPLKNSMAPHLCRDVYKRQCLYYPYCLCLHNAGRCFCEIRSPRPGRNRQRGHRQQEAKKRSQYSFFHVDPPSFLLYLFYPVIFPAVYYGTHYTGGHEQPCNPQQVIAVAFGFGGSQRYAPVSYTHLDVYKRQASVSSGL